MLSTLESYGHHCGPPTRAAWASPPLPSTLPLTCKRNLLLFLIDGDPNRSVCGWAINGNLPFEVIHLHQATKLARNYEHAVIDTSARLEPEEIKELVEGCDLLVIPSTPDALSLQAALSR